MNSLKIKPMKRGIMVRKPRKAWRKAVKRAAKRSKLTHKPPSISKLIKTADALFSARVRRIGAWEQDGELWNKDYTTDYKAPIKKLQCGHYLSRYYKAARWHFDNARPQSMMSNMWMRGDPIRFRQNLVKEIGEARVLYVESLRDAPIKLSREFLENKIKELSTAKE